MSKKKNNDVITLKGGFIKLKSENIHCELQEIKRGCGVQKNKKGKGSYNRKNKHKNSIKDGSCAYSFLCNSFLFQSYLKCLVIVKPYQYRISFSKGISSKDK